MRRARPASLLASLATVATVAVADPAVPEAVAGPTLEPVSVHIVGRAGPDAAWTDGPTEARLADAPELAVVVVARERHGRRVRRVVVADPGIDELRLRRRRIRAPQRRTWSELGQVSVQWSVVEPHAWRQEGTTASNGVGTRFHSNVSMSPASYGEWLGYDQLAYFETVVAPWSSEASTRRRPASALPPRPSPAMSWPAGLGTLRYKVEIELPDQRVLATPGADAVDQYGILPSVHRVSIRSDDTFVGWLSAYFQVPEVFGSAGPGKNHQTERFTGADCADVLTGALRRAGHRKVWHTSVAALGQYTRRVSDVFAMDDAGATSTEIAGIAVGDIIRIDYGGALADLAPRAWDHVAVVYRDRSDPHGPHAGGPDGVLDGFDVVVHMGHPHLVVEPLANQTPARMDVLRWHPRKIGRRR